MRLLHVRKLRLQEFYEPNIPPYVIASHRWTNDECTFKDIQKWYKPNSLGLKKVKGFCSYISAFLHEEWLWIDTVCIDKSSSAELGEAINSMFNWYRKAASCIVYLGDVTNSGVFPLIKTADNRWAYNLRSPDLNCFGSSKWFTRGWTLQELLASKEICFVTAEWHHICYKTERMFGPHISHITGIPERVLEDSDQLFTIPVEERVLWLQQRETTRREDMAYCILGICNVYLPLIYGEGDNAWTRLEDELSRKSGRRVELTRPEALLDIHQKRVTLVDSSPKRHPVSGIPIDESRPQPDESQARILTAYDIIGERVASDEKANEGYTQLGNKEAQARREEEKLKEIEVKVQREIAFKRQELLIRESQLRELENR